MCYRVVTSHITHLRRFLHRLRACTYIIHTHTQRERERVKSAFLLCPPRISLSLSLQAQSSRKHRETDIRGEHVSHVSVLYQVTGCMVCTLPVSPSLNPFLNLLCTFLKCDILPVPVCLRRSAFGHQLYDLVFALGYPHAAHVDFCMWNARFPQRRHSVCDLLRRFPNDPVPFPFLPIVPHALCPPSHTHTHIHTPALSVHIHTFPSLHSFSHTHSYTYPTHTHTYIYIYVTHSCIYQQQHKHHVPPNSLSRSLSLSNRLQSREP